MPKPALPPTPQSSTLPSLPPPTLSSPDFTFSLPPPALETSHPARSDIDIYMKTPPSPPPRSAKRRRTTINSSSTAPASAFLSPPTPPNASTTRSSVSSAAKKSSSSSSSSSSPSTYLPPPPTRARKIIQMAPKPISSSTTTSSTPSTSTTTTTAPKPAPKSKVTRKTAHSLIERRRRSKMNEEFGVLKSLVPACQGVEMHKLAVLQAGIEYVRYLERCVKELREREMGGGGCRCAGSGGSTPDGVSPVEGEKGSSVGVEYRYIHHEPSAGEMDVDEERRRREDAERRRELAEMEWQQQRVRWPETTLLHQNQPQAQINPHHGHQYLQPRKEEPNRLPSISPLLDATAGATLLLLADEEVGRRHSTVMSGSSGGGGGGILGLAPSTAGGMSRTRGLSVGELLSC
ncbi:hypothetical protein EX30DRAFT_375380 [Ascodesmis nigricans]|uniref:BHLH domain-containing protein n=1 Tax=Ascodesmis nigricans TaxID=341454 RepID=A0A4S2MI62_9PEZI|nr:hypothetical protein EX30DRAFT_375380 [Ascodesmis nigricans]